MWINGHFLYILGLILTLVTHIDLEESTSLYKLNQINMVCVAFSCSCFHSSTELAISGNATSDHYLKTHTHMMGCIQNTYF